MLHPSRDGRTDLLADGQQTLLDSVSLGLGQRAAFGEAIDGLQRGVDQLRVVLSAGEQCRAAGQQGQQGGANVPVHGQRRFSGAQDFLQVKNRGTEGVREDKNSIKQRAAATAASNQGLQNRVRNTLIHTL